MGKDGESFWDYSLALYARPRVEPALLALQDEAGLEVNLILFCCYAAARGVELGAPDIDAMRRIGTVWAEGVVRTLRDVRRALKPLAATPETEAARLRDEVKQAELAAEKTMQEALEALLPEHRAAGSRELAERNLAAWLGEASADPRLAIVLDRAFGRR